MSNPRLTFGDEVELISLAESQRLTQNILTIAPAKNVLIYSTAQLTDDEALIDTLTVGLRAASFFVITKDSINSIASDILAINPSGVLIRVDNFDEISLLSSFINSPSWKDIKIPVIISSSRGGNPTFASVWQTNADVQVLQDPPNVIQLIAIFNRSKGFVTNVPFELRLETNFKRVTPAFDDFTKFFVTATSQANYIVSLSVQGIPALSTSVPIPSSGTPPFEGVLKTNIGVVTVGGEHVLSLVGVGGGLTKSALITYKTN